MEKNKVTQQFSILPGNKAFKGKFTVPGDKSVSIAPLCLVLLPKALRM